MKTLYLVILEDNSEFVMCVYDKKNATRKAAYICSCDYSDTKIKDIKEVKTYFNNN